MRPSRLTSLYSDLSAAAFLQSSPLTSYLRGPPSAHALRYLHSSLLRHDSAKTEWRYRVAVADTLFQLNQDKNTGWQMPVWLIDWEMERDPECWIQRALRWGWVEEASNWTVDLLSRVSTTRVKVHYAEETQAVPPELLARGKADVTNIPYNLIDRVLAASEDGDEKDNQRLQSKAKDLREMISRRKAELKKI